MTLLNVENLEIERINNYSIRRLTANESKEAVQLLAEQFAKKQPFGHAFYKFYKKEYSELVEQWRSFWDLYSKVFFQNDLSIGLFDLDNGGQLVGVTLAKNINMVPMGYKDAFQDEKTFIFHELRLFKYIFQNIFPGKKEIIDNNLDHPILQLCGFAIRNEHMGKRLLHRMVQANEYLGFQKGYYYALAWQTNFRTGIALKKLNYEEIAKIDVTTYCYQGVRCFQLVEDQQKYSKLWLRKIQGLRIKQSPLEMNQK